MAERKEFLTRKEYCAFLTVIAIKLQTAINFLHHEPPKHILCYHKVLGVQQKIAGLPKDCRDMMFTQIIAVRGIINYLMNGRYKDVSNCLVSLQQEILNLNIKIKNENHSKSKL